MWVTSWTLGREHLEEGLPFGWSATSLLLLLIHTRGRRFRSETKVLRRESLIKFDFFLNVQGMVGVCVLVK